MVMYAGCPTAALHAASSMSTTELGAVPCDRFRNSSGVISSNGIWRPRASPMTPTCAAWVSDSGPVRT
ncbi:hypothetical protein BGK72_34560 [Streptomyces agglomeratus]|nr:hypothetical protein BGK72_34560 [Streptomyces agglomeratus]